jgi:Golgi nucleoside diphosphatase
MKSGDTRQLLQIRMLHDQLGKDAVANINPGLSSCASDPSTASEYMGPLLKFAADNIPVEKHKETPLFILATAGMRLLPQQTQTAIIDDLIRDVPKNFSFLFPPNHVEVITGKEEGIYSWIAINYLMGRFDHSIETGPKTTIEFDNNKITRAQSISMLEMGGASVQIAFEITSNSQYEELQKRYSKESLNNLISEFNLGCSKHDFEHNYRLFVTTYLGLGANVARSTYVNSLISSTINYSTDNTSLSTKEIKLYDPCLPIDSSEMVNITRRTKNNNGSTTFVNVLKGSGDFSLCETKLKEILDPIHESSRQCSSNSSCPLTQLRQTNAPFDNSEFYGFSEFWYTTEDLLRMGGPYSFTKFSQSASNYCSTSWSVILDRFKRKLYRNADNRRLLYQCFKSAWITSVLHDGFKMPKSYTKYKSASTVNDEQVQWTLGALLYRTRFFPLRDIEQHSGVNYSKVNLTSTPYYVNYTLFILCMFAVFLCIIIYLRHLHKMVNNNNNSNNNSNISNNFNETKLSHNENIYDNDLIMIDIPEKEPLIESLR